MILPQSVQASSSVFSCKLMLPEVMEIWEVSEDLREWPLWQDKELRDLASVSISLQCRRKEDINMQDGLNWLAFKPMV